MTRSPALNPTSTRRSSLLLFAGLATVALLCPAASAAFAWDRLDFQVASDNAIQPNVASSDGQDVIVVWTTGNPLVVRYRPMENGAWVSSPIQLGTGSDPVVLTGADGSFHLMYRSGSSVVTWAGTPGNMQGPTLVSAGSQNIEAFSACAAPDGRILLAWKQGSDLWWTFDAPDYDGWNLPYQSVPLNGGSVVVAPRLVGGSWQPAIYFESNGSLLRRVYDGSAWGNDTPIPLRVAIYDTYRVTLLSDGRHALFYGDFQFCGDYFYEEDGAGVFQEQPALWSFGEGPCSISDTGPASVAAAVDPAGWLHVFRMESCFEYHDLDLWGCGFQLLWQRRQEPQGPWIYASSDEFPGSDGRNLAIDCPRQELGVVAFAWTGYDGIKLRIMSEPLTAVPEGIPPAEPAALPNPSTGTVRFRWNSAVVAPVGDLQIFDAAGKRIRSLAITPASPGQVTWDGFDDQGQAAPSGVYFWRLPGGSTARSAPVILTR